MADEFIKKNNDKKRREKEITSKIKHDRLRPNPTPPGKRSAIAARYDIEKDAAPVILAAGRGQFAEDILKVAEDNNIPFMKTRGLADLLLKLEIDTEIPQELYLIIAEILAFIFRLDQMAAKRENLMRRAKEMDNE